jgi:NADH:ubiquinone reductase (H+-translocating)
MTNRGRHRVVVVGGGFGGLYAVRGLGAGPFDITLVSESEHFLFQPLLYQCATGILSEGQIAEPLRRVLRKHRNVECVMARAVDIDVDNRTVLCRRPAGEELDLSYDYLIVATGVEQSYFGHDEYRDWAPGMKTIADALTIRRRVLGAFELAETAPSDAERSRWLTFALVGAGPTGVELAGQIRELATKTLSDEFHRSHPGDARVLLFDGGSAPLASFGTRLSGRAAAELGLLGVELHMETMVVKVDGSGLVARDASGVETHYDASTVLWTGGVQAPPLAAALAKVTGAAQDKAGRIEVKGDLTIPGHPEIYVIGDMMSLNNLPGVAEVAMQSGFYAARRIKREVTGQSAPGLFRYVDLGSAAYIARGRAVVEAGPLKLSGFVGWLFWLFIHIAFLTGFRNRVGAILTWWLAFTRDVRRERAFTTGAVGRLETIYTEVKSSAPAPGGDGHEGVSRER